MNVTPKQLQVLNLIRDCRLANGYSPTMQELADQVGVSKVTVFEHVQALMNSSCAPTVKCKPRLRQRTFDVEGAYLKGKFEDGEVLYARPPISHREYVEGDVPVVWRLKVPLYGEADAGRIWNRTLVHQLVDVQHFKQSRSEPVLLLEASQRRHANGPRDVRG